MKKICLAVATSSVLATVGFANAAYAANPPTLHGFCSTAHACADNGTNTPTSVNAPLFGFSAGGHAATGDVTIDILVPNNVAKPATYTISETFGSKSNFTATLVSHTPWTSGRLDSYLGISASPADPVGAFLPATNTYQHSATGFYVFRADLGSLTLPSNGGASDASLLKTETLNPGSYIVSFLQQSNAFGTNANSGAILETGACGAGGCYGAAHVGGVPEPASWALMLVGLGGLGAALRSRRSLAHAA